MKERLDVLLVELGMAELPVEDGGGFLNPLFDAVGGDDISDHGVFVHHSLVGIEIVQVVAFVVPLPEQKLSALVGIADSAAGPVHGGSELGQGQSDGVVIFCVLPAGKTVIAADTKALFLGEGLQFGVSNAKDAVADGA